LKQSDKFLVYDKIVFDRSYIAINIELRIGKRSG